MFDHNKILRGLTFGAVLLLGTAAAWAQGVPMGPSAAPAPLQGTWNVTITPYVCASGAPLTAAAFKARLGFHAGGTLTETNFNLSFQAGQRSSGLGSWERTGPNSYRAVFEAFVFFTSVVTPPTLPRYIQGQQRVDQSIEMQDRDHWTSTALVSFEDVNGNPLSSGCFNAVAERQQ